MGLRAERLFQKLQTIDALRRLIGTSETSELECKKWSTPEANRGILAKAACGLSNAEGGVIIIGMDARGQPNEPDLIQGFVFVADTNQVAATAREIIAEALEPGIRNIQVAEVAERYGEVSGCVVVYIAEEDGTPQRVKKGGQFYVRMATATLPMLYSQIADRFGRRPHAMLVVEPTRLVFEQQNMQPGIRTLRLIVANVGRGSARFPALRCLKGGGLRHDPGPYNTKAPTWRHFDDQLEWFSYRGSANDFLHPGEKIAVASLLQSGDPIDWQPSSNYGSGRLPRRMYFAPVNLQTSVICEGIPEYIQFFHWDQLHHDSEQL